MTAADLLVLVPWLVFAAGLAVIGWRLLVVRRRRRDGHWAVARPLRAARILHIISTTSAT